MTIEIRILGKAQEDEYMELLAQSPAAMFNHSIQYRNFLSEILQPAENTYLLAYQDNILMAAMPLFIKRGHRGAVINSLPFYGSHGAIVGRADADPRIKRRLLDAFIDLCKSENALSGTLIASPYSDCQYIYLEYKPIWLDQRIGQITTFNIESSNLLDVEKQLLLLYHQKTRNVVRKALKSGFKVNHSGSDDVFRELHSIHAENIKSVGGIPKTLSVFEAIKKHFKYDTDYRIYYALSGDEIVSLLLIFYFNNTVEYFTPATIEAYRTYQPLSLLIFQAMRDAIVEKKMKYWNWGGTWPNQDGVYLFKSRWGTVDYPYNYYTYTNRANHDEIKMCSQEELLMQYSHFFVVPFRELIG